MLGDFEDKSVRNTLNFKGVENWRKGTFELYVYDGTNNLRNLSVCLDGGGEATYTYIRQLHSIRWLK